MFEIPKGKIPPINKKQEQLVYGGNYSKFDITLLYFLLRNICAIPPHVNQWGNIPDTQDRSVSANIERIRLVRNEYYGHITHLSISDEEFEKIWTNCFNIVKDLEKYLGYTQQYQASLKDLKICSMDPEVEQQSIERLLVDEKLQETVEYRKEWYNKDILRWREDDRLFYESHNFPVMLDKVKQEPYVVFVGSPGSGKTVTVRHIALLLQEKYGYEILPLNDLNSIESYCESKNPQVFVIDDVVGEFGLSVAKCELLDLHKDKLCNPHMPKNKFLMTCRESVYRNKTFSYTFLSKKENVIRLQSEENTLTDQDKYDLLSTYHIDTDLLSSNNMLKVSMMFPFLCKMFSKKKEFRVYGPDFFISPVPCILEELDEMKLKNKINYAALVFMTFHCNKLSKEILCDESTEKNDFYEMKDKVLKICKVNTMTTGIQFLDALSELEGIFTEMCGGHYTFVNGFMFEIFAYHFGQQFPELVLKYMSSDYIANFLTVDTRKTRRRVIDTENEETLYIDNEHGKQIFEKEIAIDLCIKLRESEFQMLAERLVRDIQNGYFYNVLGNKALKNPSVIQVLMNEMKKKTHTKMISLFLSEMKKMSNLTNGHCHNLQMSGMLGETIRNSTIKAAYTSEHQTVLEELIKMEADFKLKDKNNTPLKTACFRGHLDVVLTLIKNGADINSYTGFETPLIAACSRGNLDIIKVLLNAGANVNLMDKFNTPLTAACEGGDLSIVEELISAGADTNLKCLDKSPLYVACDLGNLKLVEKLLKAGANVGDETLLTTACETGHLDIVKELIKAGVDVNLKHAEKTPLTSACYNGYLRIVEELIKAKADVNLKGKGYTPITSACISGHCSVVKLLINAGADVNIIEENNTLLTTSILYGRLGIVEDLIKAGADINRKGTNDTPLTAACYFGHLTVVEQLINAGIDVNLKGKYNTPLTAACHNGELKVVQKLLMAGADINLSNGDKTPLTTAASGGHLRIVKELLNEGAEVNPRNERKTPLVTACNFGDVSVVKELIEAGACVNAKDGDDTPLTAACYFGRESVVEVLIKYGADVNLSDGNDTPLISACVRGYLSIVSQLLRAGAEINLNDVDKTPLTAACKYGHLQIVKKLIKAGVDVNHKSKYSTPLTAACQLGQLNVVQELLKAGADVNLSDGKNTPVTAAQMWRHLKIVNELIEAGACVNLKEEYKMPLTSPCCMGTASEVEEFSKRGTAFKLQITHIYY